MLKRVFLVFVLLLVIGLPASIFAAPPVLNVAIQVEPDSLDPHACNNSTQERAIPQIYEPLVDIGDDMVSLKPVLASKWDISDDLKTYTFYLRKGVKFSDGTPFNAQAVKFNFDRINQIKKLPYAVTQKVSKLEVIDDYTVRMSLSQPFAPFLAAMRRVFMVSPAAVKKYQRNNDLAQEWFTDHSAGTGPYTVKKWVRRTNIALEGNKFYWKGWSGKHFPAVNLRVIYEPESQRMLLQQGELDIITIVNRDSLEKLKKDKNIVIETNPIAAQMYVMMNCAAGPTANVKVRKALAYAWDFETYNKLMNGLTTGSNLPIPKSLMGSNFNLENPYKYNLNKAKQLLAEAGYPNGGFTLEYLVQKGDEQKIIMYQVLQAEYAKLGIKLVLTEMDWPALLARVTDWGTTKDPERVPSMLPFYKSPDVWHPWTFLWELFHTDAEIQRQGHWNMMFYENKKVDSVIDEALIAKDNKKALQLWAEAAQMIMDDCPALFIDGRMDFAVMRKTVGGFKFRPIADNIYFYYELYRK
ncbi:MAG: ABC transporter substrate-binding protein [Bacteroidota bacterium]